MTLPTLALVTPALADANNGNWQTARRWSRLLREHYRVALMPHWQGGDQDLLIALHARRSAASVAAWHARFGGQRPLLVVLTGTDLYRDIAHDTTAQHSLEVAQRLVVLHEAGVQDLPERWRGKAAVCLQSAPACQTLAKTGRHLRALMVGHLREEKSPQTYFEAARRLAGRPDIRLDHIGAALEPAWAQQAQALMDAQPRYRWLGALPHRATRRHIQAAHLLVHPSRMEGGAHVVIEAVTSGTPVLASRIPGNLGLLGADYGGFFDWGDAAALATLLERARDDAAMLPALHRQCAARAGLFHPDHERRTLLRLLAELRPPSHGDPA